MELFAQKIAKKLPGMDNVFPSVNNTVASEDVAPNLVQRIVNERPSEENASRSVSLTEVTENVVMDARAGASKPPVEADVCLNVDDGRMMRLAAPPNRFAIKSV